MGSTPERRSLLLHRFLQPMRMDIEKCHLLASAFTQNFSHLAAHSLHQFLPTPISESILRPVADHGRGRYLAIDIGGTNLRVGFVELSASEASRGPEPKGTKKAGRGFMSTSPSDRLHRHLERSWPIANYLKQDNADGLFFWIGRCIAEVVADGCPKFDLARDEPIPLGVTFSFPMEQPSLTEAMITSMGKGFAIPANTDLGVCLTNAYDQHRHGGTDHLPPIYVAALANDSVSTLVSFNFLCSGVAHRRPSMGLILGTGSNATIPLRLGMLHANKWPRNINVLAGEQVQDAKVAVNTEWSVNGTERPLRELGWMTAWDDELSAQTERPGFQPLEYMTAGRYLGELGRIMLLDYLGGTPNMSRASPPSKLLQRGGLTTTFLSHFKPLDTTRLLSTLRAEFPESPEAGFSWTEHDVEALYRIAKAIEVRAAGIIAAAILALLTMSGELPTEEDASRASPDDMGELCELGVGYTGGCVVHFQDYLADCQDFVNQLVMRRLGAEPRLSVVLSPCHGGGITGAGILAAAALSSETSSVEQDEAARRHVVEQGLRARHV